MIYARVIDGVIHDTAPLADYFPTTTFPASGPTLEWLTEQNLFKVQMHKAYNTATQKLVQTQPYLESGVVYAVSAVSLTQEELQDIDNSIKQQNKLQAKRLLEETDWSQLADVNLTNQTDFNTYRAILRTIVLDPPVIVSWPAKPESVWALVDHG